MRIRIQGVNPEVNSGPGKFAKRLATEFSRKNHTIIWNDKEDYDIDLIFISNRFPINPDKPSVQRLDGIYLNSQVNFEGLTHKNGNNHIIETYNQVDGHIFQSQFTYDLVLKHFGMPQGETRYWIVNNGTEINKLPKKRLDYLKDYKKVIFSASSWRPNKRPEDNLAVFEELKKIVDYPIALVMVGDFIWCSAYSEDEDVYIIRQKIDDAQMKAFFRSSDYFFHMTYLDNCPNSVVEALAHSVPVLCSESGGTKELLHGCGYVAMEDWNTEIQNTYEPSKMPDLKGVAEYIAKDLEKTHDFTEAHKNIDISCVADQYLALLEEVYENYGS